MENKITCPYCGSRMKYYTHGVRGCYQVAFCQCPKCKAKTPTVTRDIKRGTDDKCIYADMTEDVAMASRIAGGYTKAANAIEDIDDEVMGFMETAENLNLYLETIRVMDPEFYDDFKAMYVLADTTVMNDKLDYLFGQKPELKEKLEDMMSGLPGFMPPEEEQ